MGMSAPGERRPIGTVRIAAPNSARPRVFVLHASLEEDGKPVNENSWRFCAYPRPSAVGILGVYSEAGAIPGVRELTADRPLPKDVRLLITRRLSPKRHAAWLAGGTARVMLVQSEQFFGAVRPAISDTCFLNAFGGAFGGLIRRHPVLDDIPHEGRLDPVLYGLISHARIYPLDKIPQVLADGAIVLGLELTPWVTVVKNPARVTLLSDVAADNGTHLLLCGLDLLEDCPESRYVLSRVIHYMLSDRIAAAAGKCPLKELGRITGAPGTATIYLNFNGDDGKGSSLHPACKPYGTVTFQNGRCTIGRPGETARLELPNPVWPGESWSVEFTVQDFDKLVTAVGNRKLVFGLQYSNHATATFWRPGSLWANAPAYPGRFAVGAVPDVWADSLTNPSWAVAVPVPPPRRVTVRVVADAEEGTCNCYVAYGDDATTAKKGATRLSLAARMPMKTFDWNAPPGFLHLQTIDSPARITIDDVIVQGPFGQDFGKLPSP